jgi:hypothetical protein
VNPAAEMHALLAEIEQILSTVMWSRAYSLGPDAKRLDVQAFEGESGDWYLLAVSFDIEPQGFQPSSRGYDGVGRKGSTIIRFTRPLAERAFKAAVGHG